MVEKEVIKYDDYTDEELINYIINNKLKKTDRILMEQYIQCGCKKSILVIKLRSSKYIVDKEINRILFLINKCFNKIKDN